MRSFIKIFFATLVALVVFSLVGVLFISGIVGGLFSTKIPDVGAKAVLVVDLSESYQEQMQDNPLKSLSGNEYNVPGVYDVVRIINFAKKDSSIKGIYIKCNGNGNGFATSEEIRNALADFKRSGKFIYAYGDVIPQKAYYVANIADKIYCNPKGGVDWKGFAIEEMFFKGLLEKLEIQPQIFYAGKFKSATEPFREEKMTDANRIQLTDLLNQFYNMLLYETATARQLDTTTLRSCVNEHLIQYANDALKYKLVDGLKYDDEVKDELKAKLFVERSQKINFITLEKYGAAVNFKKTGSDKIALIYAQGDIIDGKGDQDLIGSETYRKLIKNARLDKDIKAVVIRINSGGGSALASENIWREITITRKEKPVVISFGDVAASGGYYLSCNADSIFAQANTITGSIGVFTLLPNMQQFFKNKLGVTFDAVKTAPDADELSTSKPLTEMQKRYFQNSVDTIYKDFKTRVAEGRKRSVEYIDSIAQGRVWIGEEALHLGLVDRIGGLQDAIDCAARMAKVSDYRLREFPEPKGLLDALFGSYKRSVSVKAMKEELGDKEYKTFMAAKKVKSFIGIPQARLLFDFSIE
ncbi:MAG TPA: signal peptide peptidase SppA [Puia sp.]|nr:signal peptide peptidase SppA [Puia sp.]